MIVKLKNIKLNSANKPDVYVFVFEAEILPADLTVLKKFDHIILKTSGLQKRMEIDSETGEVVGGFSEVNFQASDIKLTVNYDEDSISGSIQVSCYVKEVASKFLDGGLRGKELELTFDKP